MAQSHGRYRQDRTSSVGVPAPAAEKRRVVPGSQEMVTLWIDSEVLA